MSTRISLLFSRNLDLELLEKGVKIWLHRLIVRVRFRTQGRWGKSFPAIVDTGAPVSVIPKYI